MKELSGLTIQPRLIRWNSLALLSAQLSTQLSTLNVEYDMNFVIGFHSLSLLILPSLLSLLSGWNELLIASFSHRSIAVKDGILLATGLHVHRNSAHSAGVGAIFDR